MQLVSDYTKQDYDNNEVRIKNLSIRYMEGDSEALLQADRIYCPE